MKVATKFTLALVAGISILHAGSAVGRIRRQAEFFTTDVADDEQVLGRVLAHAVKRTWDTRGRREALDLIQDATEKEAHIDIRWVWLDADPEEEPEFVPLAAAVELEGRSHTAPFVLRLGDEDGALVTYVPVDVPEDRPGAIEVSDQLRDEQDYLRRSVQNILREYLFLLGLCALVAWGLGAWLIAKPVRLLVEQARRVGGGDFRRRVAFVSGDELGQLAHEMGDMCDNLTMLRERAEVEEQARLVALEQLRHADRLRTVGVLASGVAHELGTPLNVIDGHARLIIEDPDVSPLMNESAEVITRQCSRMTDIIRQLLDFARSGGVSDKGCELRHVVDETLRMLEPLARRRQIAMSIAPQSVDVLVRIAFEPLQQVLTNIIVNALQATEPGGQVVVTIERAAKGFMPEANVASHYAQIIVEDSGRGMDDATVTRVFEPFFTTKDVGEGTGLGLSVAYGIVQDYGGFIHVRSEIGRGSRFSIVIPASEQ